MDFIQNLLGGAKPSAVPIQDDAFGDYAAPAAASPIHVPGSPADASAAQPTIVGPGGRPIVYTKWYRIWERTTLADFYVEMIVIPLVLLALLVHYWGTRRNRRRARKFMATAQPILENEFALVGFGDNVKDTPYQEGIQSDSAIAAAAKLSGDNLAKDVLKEKSACEFESYATGRNNTAFVDIKVVLWKWYNPFLLAAELAAGLVSDSLRLQPERIEAILYGFDGNEKSYVEPPVPGSEEIGKVRPIANSTYDQFIFAVVNKLSMRQLRDERYDLSLTFTKEHAKLPNWLTVMSESAEISDIMLTKELISAIEKAGDNFEYLIITDQPVEKPITVDEAAPKKRMHLNLKFPSDKDYANILPLFQVFVRFADHLVASAHFRPEVGKKIKQLRESESAKLKKVADKEVEEDRLRQTEKIKKEERDRKMKGMTAEEQRKFLEKEADKTRRKAAKKSITRG